MESRWWAKIFPHPGGTHHLLTETNSSFLFLFSAKSVQMHQRGAQASLFILLLPASHQSPGPVKLTDITSCISCLPSIPRAPPQVQTPFPGFLNQSLICLLASDLTPLQFILHGATGGIWVDWRADQIIAALLKVIQRSAVVFRIKSKAFGIACLILYNRHPPTPTASFFDTSSLEMYTSTKVMHIWNQ